MSQRIRIGDIIEIPTKEGLAYAQYTHQHRQFGGLIRVFNRILQHRPHDLTELANSPVRFSTFLPVRAATKRGIFKVVGHSVIASANQPFPTFRDGVVDRDTRKVGVWWLWDGQREWKVGTLTPDQKELPIREVLNDTMLISLIETGWTPASDPTT